MSKKAITSALAVLLTISVAMSAALLVAPQRVHAQSFVGCIGGLVGSLAGGGSSATAATVSVPVNSIVGNVINGGTEATTISGCINDFVIMPLIHAAIRAILQKMTASVVNWINGGNGTNQPSYVQDLQGHLQLVGDISANNFLTQFGVNSNSPFVAAITSSLRTNYLQNTSSAGFFAANQDTLTQASPNVGAFLAGDWSQGGVGAWLALTTQSQNNPYMLYQAAQSQLGALVATAQDARLNELNWGQGFLSWCGPAGQSTGTNPADSCKNADGSPGQTETPGSIIHDYTQQAVVNSGFQQLISANDLDSALSAIITALLNQVLGGAGGLLGASQTTNNTPSLTTQLQNYSLPNSTTANTTAATASVTATLQAALSQVAIYQSAWQSISTAANAASTAVTTLKNSCTSYAAALPSNPLAAAALAEATAAQNAITTEINPVLANVSTSYTTASAMQAMIQQIQNELNSGISYTTDLQTLQTMPPTNADVTSAVQNAQTTAIGATATPTGSLTVSGGSTVDQMNLISANATALRASVCP